MEERAFMKPKICFISTTARNERPLLDPSVRYRCFHPAEMLSEQGAYCVVYSASAFFKDPCFDFDIYIFHRPNLSPATCFLPRILDTLHSLHRTVIADYDDLIVGEDNALHSSIVKNRVRTPEDAKKIFQQNTDALLLFEKVFTSTFPLAQEIRKVHSHAKIQVVPNILPNSILSFGKIHNFSTRPRSKNAIGYFAGTKSHDEDIKIIEDVLYKVLIENEDYRLFVIGPLVLPQSLASLPNVFVTEVVAYLRLFNLMSMCSTVVAPLEKTPFNECKSRVKFLEAAVSGCHLIASPIDDMQRVGSDHLTLAYSNDDWYEALSEPVSIEERKVECTKNLDFLEERNLIKQYMES